ncbi:hypothetical protein B1T45_11420 [Mycobacterium kansasii]|uniref:Uncharacterized protein n=3 Tax=Mycobacterium kansasii TaxID=1768 RepID=A0A1V3WRS8_MYCKA|nr:hypothetical protein MKAN_17840 [Mycobacterium kansasii ATCC 12478]ARG56356.1 hypothetical protein B1T43_11335 [Mycobacterium kansasii]EUA04931.1 hypothetical protein I547_1905 [Mycobacterium kansasii 824]EUA15858.1 hypothetical protein I545_4499 [Mycobacterium kansasii 662]ARG61807.1 hypothetical protein B1T45_11420 [Mycobacterium kansasii]
MCIYGIDIASWAVIGRSFRPGCTLDAVAAHSTPWLHTRRRGCTLDAASNTLDAASNTLDASSNTLDAAHA